MAYARLRRIVPTRELHKVYEPNLDELAWARGLARSSEHLLALVVLSAGVLSDEGRQASPNPWRR